MADYSQFFPQGAASGAAPAEADYSAFFPQATERPVAQPAAAPPPRQPAPPLAAQIAPFMNPVSAVTTMAGRGLSKFNEAVEKGAYEAGGRVTDVATQAGFSPETSAKIGFGTNVGIQAIPNLMTGAIGARALQGPMESGARSLMQSAVKPRIADLKSGKAAAGIETMLQEGVTLSTGGMQKLQGRIASLEDDITAILDKSPATVDKYAVASTLRDAFAKVQKELSPGASTKAVQDSFAEFLSHPLLQGGSQIPVKLAQEMKQAAYRKLGDAAYGQGVRNPATELAEKTLARGLREQSAIAEPAMLPLLQQQSPLVRALGVMQPRALMEGNKNPVGLGLLASDPRAALAFAVDRSAYLKSLAALGLYSGARVPGGLLGVGDAAIGQER